MDNYDKNTTSEFAKLDIKYGFWRIGVSDIDAWNFVMCFQNLKKVKNIEEIEVVVQNWLQMG